MRAKYISGFNDQPFTNLIVPITAARPTPAPTITTKVSLRLLRISNKYGASFGFIDAPKAFNAPIAGSAYVTPTPRMAIIIKTTNMEAFLGSVSPIIFPKGIRPTLRPSIKIAKPIITATKPKVIVEADAIGCLNIKS